MQIITFLPIISVIRKSNVHALNNGVGGVYWAAIERVGVNGATRQ